MAFKPDLVFVEEPARPYPLTARILKRLAGVPVEVVPAADQAVERVRTANDPIGRGKRALLLAVHPGRFIKPCPCTPAHIGCGYFIINLHLNCPLDCSYCILQGYLSNPLLTVHVNLDDLWTELDAFLSTTGRKRPVRIGTGELADSLALDPIAGSSLDLIQYFRGRPEAVLELKTKTGEVDLILRAEPADNVVVSWSLNTPQAARTEEGGAASIEERLEAAAAVVRRGFRVGFHFDPLLRFSDWRRDYGRVVRDLFRAVAPGSVAWISLGSLRFPPALKPIVQRRFPSTRILAEELIRGRDGKFRYFRPLRVELYRALLDEIRTAAGGAVPVYLCMESAEVWKDVLKKNPGGKAAVASFLSPRR
jgi:spore photoproduct lyase